MSMNGAPIQPAQDTLERQHETEEFIPGDNIAQFYIFFGIVLLVPYNIFLILANNPGALGWFAYHPPLLAIALSALAYAISPLQPSTHPDTTKTALDTHGLWAGFIATPLFIAGASAMYQQKENFGKEHFTSWHGTLGGLGASYVIVQTLGGFAHGGGYVPRKYRKYHRLSGYLLFTLLTATVALGGLYSNFVVQRAWTATRFIVFGLGPMSILGGVLSRARSHKLRFP